MGEETIFDDVVDVEPTGVIKRISPTTARRLVSCEFQFFAIDILKYKEPANANLFFGLTFDDSANLNYSHKKTAGKDLPKGDLQDYFKAKWDSEKEKVLDWEEESPDEMKESGLKGIEVFHQEVMQSVQPDDVQPKLEMSFVGNDLKLVGRPDFIETSTVIGDNKTAKASKPETFIKQAMQPVMYSILKDLLSDKIREVRFDILVRTKKPKVQQLKTTVDREYRVATLKFLSGAIEKINTTHTLKNFLPTAFFRGGWECGYCAVSELCRKTWNLPVPDSKLSAIKKAFTVKTSDKTIHELKKLETHNEVVTEHVTTQAKSMDVEALKRNIIV